MPLTSCLSMEPRLALTESKGSKPLVWVYELSHPYNNSGANNLISEEVGMSSSELCSQCSGLSIGALRKGNASTDSFVAYSLSRSEKRISLYKPHTHPRKNQHSSYGLQLLDISAYMFPAVILLLFRKKALREYHRTKRLMRTTQQEHTQGCSVLCKPFS